MRFQAGPIPLAGEASTRALASCLAPRLRAGDCILLEGPIGAGKTAFARSLIRSRLGDDEAEVPSPTFTLVQSYETPGLDIWHCDLYRLGDPAELAELGIEDAFETALCLIEWPDRLGPLEPEGALRLILAAGRVRHSVRADAPAGWRERIGDCLV